MRAHRTMYVEIYMDILKKKATFIQPGVPMKERLLF